MNFKMYSVDAGTTAVAVHADGRKEYKQLTKPFFGTSATADVTDNGCFRFPLKDNAKGWLWLVVNDEDVHDEELEERFWDAEMQRSERAEDARVAAYKAQRDDRNAPNVAHGHPDRPIESAVKDGTYTVVHTDGSYSTVRFETSTNRTKRDGTPNTWLGKQFVQYLSGPDNETDFQSFGTWERGDVQVWRKHQNSVAIAKYVKAALVVAGSDDPTKFGEAYALRSGRCCNCGRKLTVPASLHRGMGPVCAEGGRDS